MQRLKKSQKSYSPVRVANPITDAYLVCLKANQGFVLVVSQWYNLLSLDFDSPYFKQSGEETLRDGTKIFQFKQIYDLTQWSKVGSVYLGEVILVGEDTAASLCVVLSSDTKNVFTVINPRGTELKIHPNQTLEVVLYDNEYEKWKYKVVPGEDSIKYKLLHHAAIPTNIDVRTLFNDVKTSHDYMSFPRSFDSFDGIEHHYWFELDLASINKILNWKTGTFKGGQIIFEPDESAGRAHVLHINLSVKGKYRKTGKIMDLLPSDLPFSDENSENGEYDLEDSDLSRLEDEENNSNDLYDDYHDYHQQYRCYPQYQPPQYQQSSYKTTYQTHKALPLIQTVEIKERVIAETMDPLFQGTTIQDQSLVVVGQFGRSQGKFVQGEI